MFLFVAASPFVFMPSVVAYFTKNPRLAMIAIGNCVVWAFGLVTVRSIAMANSGDGFVAPVPIDLGCWLFLLFLAIKPPAKRD